jgi:hypothetical protein
MLHKTIVVIIAATAFGGMALAHLPMPRRTASGAARAFMALPSIFPTIMPRRSMPPAPSTAGTGFGPAGAGREPGPAELSHTEEVTKSAFSRGGRARISEGRRRFGHRAALDYFKHLAGTGGGGVENSGVTDFDFRRGHWRE